MLVFVKFKGQGAYEQTQPDEVLHNKQEPVKKQGEATSIKEQVENQARQAAQDSGAEIRYTVHNTMRGVAPAPGNAEKIRSLAGRDDVERITPIVAKKSMNAYSDIDSKAVQAWAESTGYTGKGVKIAVVDSGIDYTHTDFGGPGTKEAYEKAKTLTDLPDADSGLSTGPKWLAVSTLWGMTTTLSTRVRPLSPITIRSTAVLKGMEPAGTAPTWRVPRRGTG